MEKTNALIKKLKNVSIIPQGWRKRGKSKVSPILCQNCAANKSCEWVIERHDETRRFEGYSSGNVETRIVNVKYGYQFNPANVLNSENLSLLINKNTGNCAKKDRLEGCHLRVLYFEPFVAAEKAVANQMLEQLEMTKIVSNNFSDAEKQIEAIKNKKDDIARYINGLKIKALSFYR